MKKRRWAIDPDKSIGWIMKFIHKYLKMDPDEKIVSNFNLKEFIYIYMNIDSFSM